MKLNNKMLDTRCKKMASALFILLFTLFIFNPKVSAHVLESSGSIGAVLHIDPEDDPIAGQQASFFFEFKDKQNKFKPQECDCTFFILENGKQIYTQPLFQSNTDPSLTNASVFFTFPQRDVYQVKIRGKPQTAAEFTSFDLTYDIRVSRESSNSSNNQNSSTNWLSTHIIHIVAAVIGIIFVGFVLTKRKKS